MKKIRKNTPITISKASLENSQNANLMQLLPNILKILQNIDVQEIIEKFLPKNNQCEQKTTTIKSQMAQTQNMKVASDFMENHQKLTTCIKQKNRPKSL